MRRIGNRRVFHELFAFVSKTIKKVTSRTAFVTVSWKKDFAEGVSHSKAAAERAARERSYKTAGSEAQAALARETFRLKRRVKVLDENARVSRPKYFKKGPRRGEQGDVRERVTDAGKENYFRHRRRKLAGQWIEDGDWHEMMTVARAINDPMLSALMKS